MPKQMKITLSLYAKDLRKLEGSMDEDRRLVLLKVAKSDTAEGNERQRQKDEADFRKEVEHICKPYGWWQWDESKREDWILAEILRMQSVIYEVDDHFFEDLEFSLPQKWEVCGRCNGNGMHDHHAFSNGFTESEWAQESCEFRGDYLNGVYGVTCTVCDGRRVTPDVDDAHLNDGQKALLELYYENLREDAEYDHTCAMERRMGA